MQAPSSTYRIQFNKDFTFKDLFGIIDYLHALGISTIYASPILKSISGSAHGYDVIDPHSIDPEIGTLEDLKEIAAELKKRNMSWLQDIVPNHMAFDTSNFRLMDVLERGPHSTYYHYFDILWNHPAPDLHNRLMVPFLGEELPSCIEKKQIQISFSEKGFVVGYFDTCYPLSVSTYDYLFSVSDSDETNLIKDSWIKFCEHPACQSEYSEWNRHKEQWTRQLNASAYQTAIHEILSGINNDKEKLTALLEHQYYILAHWKQTEKQINYRRFFTVNQLICLRMEDESVFNEYHTFLYTLFKDQLIQGFRIDHIDGLNDPLKYVRNLRGLFGDSCYIIAEKILEAKEAMPASWPLQGTSGYEFLAYTNQLYTDRKGAKQLLQFYRELVPNLPPYDQLVSSNKKLMLENYMGGEWDNLVHYFFQLGLQGGFEWSSLKQALGALMIALPVYRIYPESLPLAGKDLVIMNEAFDKAQQASATGNTELGYLHDLFVSPSPDQHLNLLSFLKRLMQFTGPLTAKGVEDTTFYVYNPLISHDEVGDSPSILGITTNEFHARMANRQWNTPLSLNATATHDTKRGEDVRMRLNVLSERPDVWQALVKKWLAMNIRFHAGENGKAILSINDEYFIYQSIVGGIQEDLVITDEWIKRLQQYLIKVVREAKVRSNWELPDENYERACTQFIEQILKNNDEFLASLLTFVQKNFAYASINSLGQVLIKTTAPGIPDIYQGCEFWDLSYVDPDNRRPVDYDLRKDHLNQIIKMEKEGRDDLFSFLAVHRTTGIEKLFVTWKTLNFRKNNALIFREGAYLPLPVTGANPAAVVYARHYNDQWVLVAVPLDVARRSEASELSKEGWENETILLPEHLPRNWKNVFTAKSIVSEGYLDLRELFDEFPIALLHSDED